MECLLSYVPYVGWRSDGLSWVELTLSVESDPPLRCGVRNPFPAPLNLEQQVQLAFQGSVRWSPPINFVESASKKGQIWFRNYGITRWNGLVHCDFIILRCCFQRVMWEGELAMGKAPIPNTFPNLMTACEISLITVSRFCQKQVKKNPKGFSHFSQKLCAIFPNLRNRPCIFSQLWKLITRKSGTDNIF